MLTIESLLDGSLVVALRPTASRTLTRPIRASLLLYLWREAGNGVRMSLRNPVTGSVAHLQSGDSLLGFAREFGIEIDE